nr:lipoprotein [Salinicola halophilus]
MWHDTRTPAFRHGRRVALGLLATLALIALVGCGQKGPLYMPGDRDAAEDYDPQGAYETQADDGDTAPGPQATPLPGASAPDAETLPVDPVEASPGMRSDSDAPTRPGMRSTTPADSEAPQ